MKAEIINPEESKQLFEHWGKFSAICYDTHTTRPSVIGEHCLNSNHFSGSRTRYIEFLITNCPRFLIDQLVRHELGVVKNVQSFRYVDKNNFAYEIPIEIQDNPILVQRYIKHMQSTQELYNDIFEYITITKHKSNERGHEQSRYVLPISTHSAVAIGMDIEALIHFCNKRLCVRTEDIHRELAVMIKNCVLEIIPKLEDYLIPQCQYLLWCPENKSCGAYPTKKELKIKIKEKQNENI